MKSQNESQNPSFVAFKKTSLAEEKNAWKVRLGIS